MKMSSSYLRNYGLICKENEDKLNGIRNKEGLSDAYKKGYLPEKDSDCGEDPWVDEAYKDTYFREDDDDFTL